MKSDYAFIVMPAHWAACPTLTSSVKISGPSGRRRLPVELQVNELQRVEKIKRSAIWLTSEIFAQCPGKHSASRVYGIEQRHRRPEFNRVDATEYLDRGRPIYPI